jgi:hypothetical protein
MDASTLHLELRNALSLADELGRYEHGDDVIARHLATARTALAELEREAGRTHERYVPPDLAALERLEHTLAILRDRGEAIPVSIRPRFDALVAAIDRVVAAERCPSAPVRAKPVFGRLPLGRALPQDAHTVVDWGAAAAYFASASVARTPLARALGLGLGAKVASVSALTDYRLSPARLLRIELHELFDQVVGAAAVIAPFALGYARRDPLASAIQIATGIGSIVAALVTDYSAVRGVTRPLRSRGGPMAAARRRRRRVSEVQRPLEGLAGPSVLPRLRA